MPIAFVINGVNLILLFANNKLHKTNLFFSFYLILSLISFMIDTILLNSVYVNILEILSIIFLFLFLIKIKSDLIIRYLIITIIILFIVLKLEINEFSYGVLYLSKVFDAYIILYVCAILFDNFSCLLRGASEKNRNNFYVTNFNNKCLYFC